MTTLGRALLESFQPEDLDALAEALASRLIPRLAEPASEEWLDTKRAAEHLGLTPDALHKLTKDRALPFYQAAPGAKCWFRRTELDAWRERDRVKPLDERHVRLV